MADERTDVTVAEQSADSIESRLARAERRLSILMFAFLGCVAGILVLFAFSIFVWKTATREFEPIEKTGKLLVTDAKQNVRAELSVNTDGRPQLRLLDERGVMRAELGLAKEGEGALLISSRDGNPRVMLGEFSTGEASVVVGDVGGRTRVALRNKGEESVVSVHDGKSMRGGIAVSDRTSRMELSATSGNPSLITAADPNGGTFVVHDAHGNPRALLGVDARGGATLSLLDAQKKGKAAVSVSADGTVTSNLPSKKPKGK